jgi:hypothetical protein
VQTWSSGVVRDDSSIVARVKVFIFRIRALSYDVMRLTRLIRSCPLPEDFLDCRCREGVIVFAIIRARRNAAVVPTTGGGTAPSYDGPGRGGRSLPVFFKRDSPALEVS